TAAPAFSRRRMLLGSLSAVNVDRIPRCCAPCPVVQIEVNAVTRQTSEAGDALQCADAGTISIRSNDELGKLCCFRGLFVFDCVSEECETFVSQKRIRSGETPRICKRTNGKTAGH